MFTDRAPCRVCEFLFLGPSRSLFPARTAKRLRCRFGLQFLHHADIFDIRIASGLKRFASRLDTADEQRLKRSGNVNRGGVNRRGGRWGRHCRADLSGQPFPKRHFAVVALLAVRIKSRGKSGFVVQHAGLLRKAQLYGTVLGKRGLTSPARDRLKAYAAPPDQTPGGAAMRFGW